MTDNKDEGRVPRYHHRGLTYRDAEALHARILSSIDDATLRRKIQRIIDNEPKRVQLAHNRDVKQYELWTGKDRIPGTRVTLKAAAGMIS